MVLERSVRHLRGDDRVDVSLVPALSFLDVAWARLGIDPVEESVRLIDGHTFARDAAGERGPLLVAHAHARWVLSDIKLAIDAGPEMTAVVLQGLGTENERILEVPWPDLDRTFDPDHLTSLYLPEVTAPVARELQKTVELMHRLRQECPWDQEQTHASLRRYLIEESYEVLEAIDGVVRQLDRAEGHGDAYADLEEELGDLWFQVLFHAELAAEAGQFTIADVARNVHDKLVARHPHVFADIEVADAASVAENWEAIKKVEKGRSSVLDGIPSALPALMLADKMVKKASRAGKPVDSEQLADVLREGLDGSLLDVDRVGNLLLAVAAAAHGSGIDAEDALRRAALAAGDRFRAIETSHPDTSSNWLFG